METQGVLFLGSRGHHVHRRVQEAKWSDTDIMNVLMSETRINEPAVNLEVMVNGNSGPRAAKRVQGDSVPDSSTTFARNKYK